MMTERHPPTVHRVDLHGRITAVNSAWLDFAHQNGWAIKAEDIAGKSWWAFIDGDVMRHLYQHMMNDCRVNGQVLEAEFRCDSPDTRRFMKLKLRWDPQIEQYEFQHELLRTESRNKELWIEPGRNAGPNIHSCSWCRQIDTGEHGWLPASVAILEMGILEQEETAKLSHGICPACREHLARRVSNQCCILIAEDHRDLRVMLKEYFISLGYRVITAKDGIEALAKQTDNVVDVALVDVFMPEMDGLELTRELGEIQPQTRIVTMSGMFDTDVFLETSMQLGAITAIRKPFNLNQVGQKILSALNA